MAEQAQTIQKQIEDFEEVKAQNRLIIEKERVNVKNVTSEKENLQILLDEAMSNLATKEKLFKNEVTRAKTELQQANIEKT